LHGRDQLMKNAKETLDLYRSKGIKDPEVRKRLEAIEQDPLYQELKQLHNREGDGSVPKEIQKLGELYKNRKEAAKAEKYSPDLAGGEQAGKTGTPEPRMSGPSVPEQMRGAPPVMGPRPGAPPSAPSEQVTPEEKLTRWLRKTLDVNKGALAESPAIQDALRQLRRARSSAEPLAADDKSWVGQFARFSQSLTKNDLWSKMDLPNLGKWQPPTSRSLPKVHSPWAAPSFEGMPHVGMPSATAIDRGLILVWVALILAAGVLAWKLLGGHVPGIKRQARRAWKLGPWPVAPGAVGTRQDVVRAFEYLSLLKLGPVAQSRNHLDLAAELGEPEIEHRNAAERLAALYEKARYTPADEALSDDALATARRELCYLAGVKQA